MELLQLTPGQLRKAAVLKEQIEALEHELTGILGATTGGTSPGRKLHWTQTPEGKARLARSLRKSWRRRGAGRATRMVVANGAQIHWTQTPAGKARMAKLMRRRWQRRRMGVAA